MAPKQATEHTALSTFALPLPYRIFFLFVEPVSTLVGAYYAHFLPQTYLHLTHAASAPAPGHQGPESVPVSTAIALSQLGNLYLLFALIEGLVLRAARRDLRVWKTLLFALLVADLGHLATVAPQGTRVYWDVRSWNAMDWGNVAFVYVGAAMRIAFLADVGLGAGRARRKLVKQRRD